MDSAAALHQIESTGIVAGMRGAFPPDVALGVADVLMNEGISVFEMMMNSEEPIAAMRALKAEYGAEACVGMGTVLDVDQRSACWMPALISSSRPLSSPMSSGAVMARGVLMGPGVATPSEAVAAWGMGVPLLKLFRLARSASIISRRSSVRSNI